MARVTPVMKIGCPRPGSPSRSKVLFVLPGWMAWVAPVIRKALPGLNPMTRSTVLFVYLGRMVWVAPAMRTARLGSDLPLHCVVHILPQGPDILPQGPGGPGVKDGDVSGTTVANAPGDALAMSIGYREIATETSDKLCMSPVNPRPGLTMCDELSSRVLCDVEVIAVALCPPGMMCKLDCPWLNPFLFASLGG